MTKKTMGYRSIMLIVFVLTILALPPISNSAEVPSTVVEVLYQSTKIIAVDTGETDNKQSLVPLRSTLEPKGIIINFNPPKEMQNNNDATFTLSIGSDNIGSKEVSLNRGRRSDNRLLFLEYPPKIINGQTMVPINFVQEVLDSVQNRDQYLKKIAVAEAMAENRSKDPKKEQIGYTYYCRSIGPKIGPSYDQARLYIFDHKILDSITRIKDTPNGFCEFGSKSTMVEGKDVSKREKAVWLTQNKYTDEISMIALVYLDQGATKSEICHRLRANGIKEKDIKKVYLAPYSLESICWYVEAKLNNLTYYTNFDFVTGKVLQEVNIPDNQK